MCLTVELDLKWTQVTPYLRVCRQLSTWYGVRLEIEGASAGTKCEVGLPHCPWEVGSDLKLLEQKP